MRIQIWESAVLCWHSTWFGHIRLVTFGDPDSRFSSLLKVTDFITSHQEASFSCWKIHGKEHRSRLNLMGCMEKNHQSTQVGPRSISASQFCQARQPPDNPHTWLSGPLAVPVTHVSTCRYESRLALLSRGSMFCWTTITFRMNARPGGNEWEAKTLKHLGRGLTEETVKRKCQRWSWNQIAENLLEKNHWNLNIFSRRLRFFCGLPCS